MEPDNDDQLRPQQIDEQIGRLVQSVQEGTLENNLNVQLVRHLQGHYESEKQKTLQRAWKSIAQRYENGVSSSMEEGHSQIEQKKLEGSGKYTMREQTMKIQPIKRVLPRWGTLVAVAVLALVIGSTALILSRVAAQQNGTPGTGGSQHHSVCPPTPTPPPGRAKATPTAEPIAQPTAISCVPSIKPTEAPCPPTPTLAPIATPAPIATAMPCVPSIKPTAAPIGQPTVVPTAQPTAAPIGQPTVVPTAQPTAAPIGQPTVVPTAQPTAVPIGQPTVVPESRSTPTPLPGR